MPFMEGLDRSGSENLALSGIGGLVPDLGHMHFLGLHFWLTGFLNPELGKK